MLTPEQVHGFSSMYLIKRFDSPKPTPAFHKELWKYSCSDHPYVAIAAPRGHAKSTAITHTYTLANLCFREKNHAWIVSDTEGQAVQFLQDIKIEFEENEELQTSFQFVDWKKDSEREIVGEWRGGERFRVLAIGSNQKLRGLKWRNKRPNLIVGDDLENDEIVLNEARRFKFRSWVFNALLPAGSDYCHFRFVGTILHLDSFLERLMPVELDPHTVVEPLKTYSMKENPEWLAVKYRSHPRMGDYSQLLWKEKFSQQELHRRYKMYEAQGFPEGYNQEYLNQPIDDSSAFFRKANFKEIPEYARRANNRSAGAEPEHFYAGVDMAISTQDSRAYTAIVVCGLTDTGILRVRDVRRFRGDTLDIIEEMFAVQSAWHPELFAIEKENIASAVGPVLYTEMLKPDRPFIKVEEMAPHGGDKMKRARPAQYRMRAGLVEFDTEADWYPSFYEEMTHFPRGKYADQVDAFAIVGMMLDRMLEVPTWDEVDEAEYEDEVAETMEYTTQGQSSWTGY